MRGVRGGMGVHTQGHSLQYLPRGAGVLTQAVLPTVAQYASFHTLLFDHPLLTVGPQSRSQPSLMGSSLTVTPELKRKYSRARGALCAMRRRSSGGQS